MNVGFKVSGLSEIFILIAYNPSWAEQLLYVNKGTLPLAAISASLGITFKRLIGFWGYIPLLGVYIPRTHVCYETYLFHVKYLC